jgi:Tol biopolymer transport system component
VHYSLRAATGAAVISLTVAAVAVSTAAAAEDKRNVAVFARPAGCCPVTDQLRIVTATGAPVGTPLSRTTTSGLSSPSWSRDETQLAFAESNQILIVPAAGGAEHKLTDGFMPAFSPARDEVAFWRSAGGGNYELRVIRADGTDDRPVGGPFASATGAYLNPPAWSPDGASVAVRSGASLVRVSVPGGATTPIVSHPGATLWSPALSPDGTRIAYARHTPPSTVQELVVRELAGGGEKILWQSPSANVQFASGFPVIAWSADSDRVVYLERDGTVSPQVTRAVTLKSDGSGGRLPIAAENNMNGVAWANASSPSYYVKHVEVAQAISKIFGPLGARDPLESAPHEETWEIPVVSEFPIPLIAGRSTLLRIYVGDATLSPGALTPRSIHYRVSAGSTTFEGDATVDVAAADVQPNQQTSSAAINAWLPGSVTASGATLTAEVEVNAGQDEPECEGCFPNGNIARVNGIAFEQGDELPLAPVPIAIMGLDGKIRQPDPAFAAVWPAVGDYLPVRDGGVVLGAPRGPLTASQAVLNALGNRACLYLSDQVTVLRALAVPPATERWVGFSSARGSLGCNGAGRANIPSTTILILRPEPTLLAHELGHSLGLHHTLGLNGEPSHGAPLPYAGIGGVGYGDMPNLFVRPALGYSDLMSYGSPTWTSPATWWRMHQAIVGHIPSARRPAASASRAGRAAARRSWRLVSGYLAGKRGGLFSSLVADATKPEDEGPTAGQLVALDRRDRIIGRTKIKGTQLDEGSGKTLPFVVALPPTAKAVALQLRTAGGSKLATLRRSAHAPSGRFLRLPRRARAGKALTVRWKASDRDRRDRLSVVVQARRARKAWRTITMGPARGKASVKPSMLGAGRKLRLRLLVSDGFTTSKVDARPITVRR